MQTEVQANSLPKIEYLREFNEDIDLKALCKPENVIGRGAFCIVYKGWNEEIIIRMAEYDFTRSYIDISIGREKYENDARMFLIEEEKLLETLDHPNIIKPIGICCQYNQYYQILPRYTKISTWKTNNQLTKELILKWTWQLFSVVSYLQEEHVIHKDIRLDNLLINENDDIILIDFNIARKVNSTDPLLRLNQGGIVSQYKYVPFEWAPELKNVDLPLDFNADLYMAILSILMILHNDYDHAKLDIFHITHLDQFNFGNCSFNEAFPELVDLFGIGLEEDPLKRISSKQAFLEIEKIIASKFKKSAKK